MVFRLLENAFASQKIESGHFYSCPTGKTLPQVLIITLPPFQAKEDCSFSQAAFFSKIYPAIRKVVGGNYVTSQQQ